MCCSSSMERHGQPARQYNIRIWTCDQEERQGSNPGTRGKQVAVARTCHGLTAGRNVELGEQPADVGIDGTSADEQGGRDLPISPAFGNEAQDVQLAPGQSPLHSDGGECQGRSGTSICRAMASTSSNVMVYPTCQAQGEVLLTQKRLGVSLERVQALVPLSRCSTKTSWSW